MADITLRNGQITRLQYEAQGFRKAFYVLFNSIFNKEGCEPWMQDGDCLSVLGTNGCFALELYLKFLIVVSTFNASDLSGKHPTGHKLDSLYCELKNTNSSFVNDLEKEYAKTKYRHSYLKLEDFLTSIKDHFMDWRYSYEKGALNINLNTLSDVLNIFEDYTITKFSKISNPFSNQQTITPDGQSMSIDDVESISC